MGNETSMNFGDGCNISGGSFGDTNYSAAADVGLAGSDGIQRPSPKEMALRAAIKSHEKEIQEEIQKFADNVREEMTKAFKEMDADGNGFLSEEEIKKVFKDNAHKWGHVDGDLFSKVDENKDGKISIEGNYNCENQQI